LGLCTPKRTKPDLGHNELLSGIYRIPAIATPLLRAALLDHQARELATPCSSNPPVGCC
jgi:hypothetical protein